MNGVSHSQQAFIRATGLLDEVRDAGWGWSLAQGIKTYKFPWPITDRIGLFITGMSGQLTDDKMEWFAYRGWLACAHKADVLVAPFAEVDPPDPCYHTTLADNEAGVLELGLLAGQMVGLSTSHRPDAGMHIHVTFTAEDGQKWAKSHLLGANNPNQKWMMFQIKREGIIGKVFRDPASQTGYILEAKSVARRFLAVIRRWSL
jgi:hypothetical protein